MKPMKCPYRVKTNKRFWKSENGTNLVRESVEFEDCYYEECPLYDYGICKRVAMEGGDL